jgi:hypothetical protein
MFQVINMAAAYLFEKESTSWFFPTSFGVHGNNMTMTMNKFVET